MPLADITGVQASVEMLMRAAIFGVVFGMAVCCGAARAADELVDNPVYKSWASCKEGTRVMYKIESIASGATGNGTKHVVEKVVKLEAVEAERVVISMTMRIVGQKDPVTQPMNIAVPAKVEKGKAHFFPGVGDFKITNLREGKDRMEVEGKATEVKMQECDIETSSNGTSVKTHVKLWTAANVPGGVVKSVMFNALGKNEVVNTTILTTLVESDEPAK
jgi:hypothetical protein